jgi:hypothetical protein
LLSLTAGRAAQPQDPALGKYPLDPAYHKTLVEMGFLPTRPHVGDFELAQKLNLELPALADVRAAVATKDPKALEKALGAYLNSRLPPLRVAPTGKPAPNAKLADQWLQPRIVLGGKDYPVPGTPGVRTLPLGEDVDWYFGSADAFVEPAQWGHIRIIGNAYANSGDPKYAEAMVRFVRSFYRTAARPPAQRPKTLFGAYGPWRSLNAAGRIMGGYLPATYREIGAAPCVTDADRVMFLKMLWEHADYCHLLLEEHVAHNFEVGVLIGLLNAAVAFPEFRDSKRWLERVGTRFADNLRDCTLDDGGLYERTGYHFAVWAGTLRQYRELLDSGAPLPPEFARRLERMSEASLWVLSPTLEFPLFGLGDMNRWASDMERAAGFFPHRPDFAFAASGGTRGKPPDRLARVLPYTGWLTMRSDWSPDALYMAVNFNGNPRSQAGHYDQLSFGLWAFGRPWMTNPGSTTSDGKEYREWSGMTIGANTVMVDDVSQDRWDNSGRLETWEDLPGFTWAASSSWAYRGLGGTHRRAILFLRSAPGYWLMVDRLSGDGRPHDYRWLGHFQPTKLGIDPVTKAIATAPQDGKRLWVVPARPDTFHLEQGSGPLLTPQPTGALPPSHPHRAIGPYVALRQKAVSGPASFAVLLYPAADGAAPVLESLASDSKDEAAGFRLRRGAQDDLLVLAPAPGARRFGSKEAGLATDGEAAFVRRAGGRLTEAGLVAGRRLEAGGTMLIGAGPEVLSVHVRYDGDRAEVSTRGRGEARIARGRAARVVLNGRPADPRVEAEQFRLEVGNPGPVAIADLVFATDPASRCKGIGVPLGYGGSYQGPPQSALVRFKTSVPSDTTVEWRGPSEAAWKRVVNPEVITDHYYLLTDLEPGKTYLIRLTCRSPEGRVGVRREEYTFNDPPKGLRP